MSDKVILDPQTSGNNNIVKLTDALGNSNYFVRSFKQGAEVLIPLADVIKYVDDSTKDIKSVIPPDTTAENPLVNEKALRELMLNTIGGRTYKTTKIGNKIWLAENLDFKFQGLKIGTEETEEGEPYAAYYNNDEATYGVNGNKYGLLYNWYAVNFLNKYKDQLIPGWRVASYYDWKALATDAGGDSIAGTKLKARTGWDSGAGTDDFGFAAFPAGMFLSGFSNLGNSAYFWTTSEYSSPDKGWSRSINTSAYLASTAYDKSNCFSVRLVRDA